MAAIALGFASAVVWGAADFLGGVKSRQLQLLTVLLVSQAAGLVAVLAWAAARGEGPPAEVVPWALANAVSGTVGLAAFYRALAVGAMGVVAPISASAAVIPVVVGVAGGERPGAVQLAGIVVAIAGVAVASYEPPDAPLAEPGAATATANRGGSDPGRRPLPERDSGGSAGPRGPRTPSGPRRSSGAGLALVAAAGFGVFFVGLDEGSNHDLVWTLVLGRTLSTAILAVAALAMRPSLRMTGRDSSAVVAVGLLDMGANALFAAGSTLGLVSVVAVLGSLYPVTTLVLARFVLGERLHRIQRGGALVALVGVALISAG
ncbi:MAG TPA: DMT family transporter [Thermoleophilaceae bacterium]|jgi:drug/metabolite transporter (DMT)-like permease